MEYYENIYKQNILPLYGHYRKEKLDEILLQNNILPHNYSIINRIDMTHINVYSIDPDGCEDADDAFSIFNENNKLYLAIHIADPTEYINLKSDLWNSIKSKNITQYPSNNKPIHMLPNNIMKLSSLLDNEHGNIKNAITIITEINKENYKPINNIKLLFTTIKVDISNSLSYSEAGTLYNNNNNILNIGIKISKSLQDIRSKKTVGVILNELSYSYVKYSNQHLYLYCDNEKEKEIKQMIAEFAIFANSFIGEYLKLNFNGKGLFRTCDTNEWFKNAYNISGQELLNEIIINGIKAEYMSTINSHDLVGAPEYCHFTSPIRRISDCICHYLLKYIHLKENNINIDEPFTVEELEQYSSHCIRHNKLMKNIQHKDNKFRLIQTISYMLSNNQEIKLGYYISSYTGMFLNIIINKINEHNVYISYTLRIQNLQKNIQIKQNNDIIINHVNCITKYDQGSIPQLDNIFIQ
tara:strand:+ start:394 stop:1797 length:1404 start_codon:yes stop_codon:yes gene_type:complete